MVQIVSKPRGYPAVKGDGSYLQKATPAEVVGNGGCSVSVSRRCKTFRCTCCLCLVCACCQVALG